MQFTSCIFPVLHRLFLCWDAKFSSQKTTYSTKKKSLRLFFLNRNAKTNPFFKNSKILKFSDKVALQNCLSVSDSFHTTLTKIFGYWVTILYHRTKTYDRCNRYNNCDIYLELLARSTLINHLFIINHFLIMYN